jgi:hypothetical protein
MGTHSLFPRIKASRIVNLQSAELKNVRGLPPRPVFAESQILGSPVIFIMLVDYMQIEQSKAFVLLGRFGTADNQQVSLSPAMRHG